MLLNFVEKFCAACACLGFDFLSLSFMVLRFTHDSGYVVCSFLWLCSIPLCDCVTMDLSPFLMVGLWLLWMGLLQTFLVKSAGGVHGPALGMNWGVVFLGCRVWECSLLQGNVRLFSKAVPVYSPTSNIWDSVDSLFSLAVGKIRLLDFCQSNGYKNVS